MARWPIMVLAAVLMVLASPVFALAALLVRLTLGAPVLFRQQRSGLQGTPFTLVKFRSMTDACGADGALLPDALRTPWAGRLIRRTRLDELPQLPLPAILHWEFRHFLVLESMTTSRAVVMDPAAGRRVRSATGSRGR